jgi:hypothetical protein
MSNPLIERTVTVEHLPARQLMVDHSVQRSLDPGRAQRIAEDFDPNALGMLVVSRRDDGTLHIVDGQHRHAVVVLLNHEDWNLHCQVHTGLSREEEARMFRLLNNAKPPSVLERFLVRIQEGDPIAVTISNVLAEKGWRIGPAKVDGMFSAVSSIEKPYVRAEASKKEGEKLVTWVTEVCTKAFGHDSNGVRGEIVTGLAYLYLRHGEEIDTAKLIQQMAVFNGGARGLVSRARSLKDYRSGTVGDAMAEHMINLINKGKRRENWLPDWRDAEV